MATNLIQNGKKWEYCIFSTVKDATQSSKKGRKKNNKIRAKVPTIFFTCIFKHTYSLLFLYVYFFYIRTCVTFLRCTLSTNDTTNAIKSKPKTIGIEWGSALVTSLQSHRTKLLISLSFFVHICIPFSLVFCILCMHSYSAHLTFLTFSN